MVRRNIVKVIDAHCGAGKTEFAIQYMNEMGASKFRMPFIFVTPYLNEIERVKVNVTTTKVISPESKEGKGRKVNHIKHLFETGEDIACTHALFKEFDIECVELIKSKGYTLILDEVFNVLHTIDTVRQNDIKTLLNQGWLKKEEKGKVKWSENAPRSDHRYLDLVKYADNDNLYLLNDKCAYWSFPVSIFEAFDNIYILTYLFKGQIQRCYYDLHNVEYDYYSLIKDGIIYKLVQFNEELEFEFRSNIKEKINIYEGNMNYNYLTEKEQKNRYSLNQYNELSKSWLSGNSEVRKNQIDQLRKNLETFFRNECNNAKNNERLWTTLKEKKESIGSAKYRRQFISWTTRATNNYKNVENIAFIYNRFINPIEKNYFETHGIDVDQNLLAISDLIQWIFRSRLRQGDSINLYLPSYRMRVLLNDYLENKTSI